MTRTKRVKGFGTGDLVVACVPKGVKVGNYKGRVAVRASGSFNINTGAAVVQGISHKHCRLAQRADGYGYFFNQGSTLSQKDAVLGRASHDALSLPGLKAGVSRADR